MRKETILLCSLALATLASCSSDEAMQPEGGNGKAEFFATINGQPLSRAYDQVWEADDHIGISCTTGDKTYTNVDYKHSGGGNFAVQTPGSEIYYQTDAEVTFTAYYPWTDLQGTTSITADTWHQSAQKSFDFLWAQQSGSKTKPNVAFAFNHKMTKLVLTVKKGADVSFDEVNSAKLMLDGFLHEGTFNTATGEAQATGNASTMWEFAGSDNPQYNAPKVENGDESVTYTLIMFPQSFENNLPFTATLPGKQSFTAGLDFTTANSDTNRNEWVAGRQYNLSVTLHKTSVTVDGCTIVGWEEVPGGNFDAN